MVLKLFAKNDNYKGGVLIYEYNTNIAAILYRCTISCILAEPGLRCRHGGKNCKKPFLRRCGIQFSISLNIQLPSIKYGG
jgi:hypothetical protein